jgi:hypothetical protein
MLQLPMKELMESMTFLAKTLGFALPFLTPQGGNRLWATIMNLKRIA